MSDPSRTNRPEDVLIEAVLQASGVADVYRFGRFTLDVRAEQLAKDGVPLTLPPKEFDTLRCLAEAKGRLVTKAELLARVWPGVHADEGTLAHRICALRKVLGVADDGKDYIETVPRRGYRLVQK